MHALFKYAMERDIIGKIIPHLLRSRPSPQNMKLESSVCENVP